jgi:hypothetical protein
MAKHIPVSYHREGYYDEKIQLTSGTLGISIPFIPPFLARLPNPAILPQLDES